MNRSGWPLCFLRSRKFYLKLPALFFLKDRGFNAILQQFYIFAGAAGIAGRGHLWYHGRELRIFGVKREWRGRRNLENLTRRKDHLTMKPKFDGYAAQYDAWFMENENLFQSELRLFQKALGDIAGQRVLSVGCGSGLFESMIDRSGIEGIEPSRDMGAIAQKRGINVIAFGAIEEVELEENAYDVIYLNGSSSYMEDLTRAFGVCKKALKPGGRFISLDVPKESAFGFMYLLAKNAGTFDHPSLNGVMPKLPYPLELCCAGVWHSTEEKIDALKALGFHDFDFYQTLLKNPMYTNDDVEDVVPGYQSGGYVAIIARK